MLDSLLGYACLLIPILMIGRMLYIVFVPRNYFMGIRFGKIDVDSWSGRDYMDWYKNHILKGHGDKNTPLVFKATMCWNTAYYKKFLLEERLRLRRERWQ